MSKKMLSTCFQYRMIRIIVLYRMQVANLGGAVPSPSYVAPTAVQHAVLYKLERAKVSRDMLWSVGKPRSARVASWEEENKECVKSEA